MEAKDIKIGRTYIHRLHGQCVVLRKNRLGYWIDCWGGINGDKLYTFKGIQAKDLSPLLPLFIVPQPSGLVPCRECLEEFEEEEIPDGICDECSREECEECDGTGDGDEWDDDSGLSCCPNCGGDGVV